MAKRTKTRLFLILSQRHDDLFVIERLRYRRWKMKGRISSRQKWEFWRIEVLLKVSYYERRILEYSHSASFSNSRKISYVFDKVLWNFLGNLKSLFLQIVSYLYVMIYLGKVEIPNGLFLYQFRILISCPDFFWFLHGLMRSQYPEYWATNGE